MPIAKIQLPDGRIAKFEVPEGTSPDQVTAFAAQHFEQPAPEQAPIEDPSFIEGMGKGMYDSVQGISDLFGNADPLSLGDTSVADQKIGQSFAGSAGELAGNVAMTAPAMLIPGAGTIKGGAAIGAGLGALLNEGDIATRAKDAAAGAVGGAAGGMLPYAGKMVSKALAPFGGPSAKEKIIGELLLKQADDATPIIQRLESAQALVPGSQPTAAEVANSGGIAALQRFAEQANPEEYAFRRQANAAARRAAVDKIAGTDSDMAAALGRRERWAGPLYEQAKQQTVPVDDTLRSLLKRPSMQNALAKAEQIAAESGAPIDPALKQAILTGNVPADISGEGLHWLKIGLDAVKKDPSNPLEGQMLRSVMNTADEFGKWREAKIPTYATAQQLYGILSKPVNKMEIGRELAKKVNSALSDGGPYTRETAESFARAVRDIDQTAVKATGFKGAKAADILSKKDMSSLEKVVQELNRKAAADELGRGVGSNTFQNFAMNGIGEAAGIPSWISGALRFIPPARSAMNIGRNAAGGLYANAEKDMQGMLSQALLDPKKTAELMKNAQVQRVAEAMLIRRLGFAPEAVGIGLANYSQ